MKKLCPAKIWSAKEKIEIDNALASNDFIAQEKLDGASYTLYKDENGKAHLYSGSISKKDGQPIDKIDNTPHIKTFIETEFKNNSAIIAELYTNTDYSTGETHKRELSSYTNTIMLCTSDRAIKRQEEYGYINCYMFDILYWDDEDIASKSFKERDKMLNDLFCTFSPYSWLSKAKSVMENKKDFLASILAKGGEGIILKRLDAPNMNVCIGETPKRPAHTTIKIKQIDTIDVVIMGLEYPTKTYNGKAPDTYLYRDADGNPINRLYALGMINAFDIGLYNENGDLVKIGTVASGLDDNIRLAAATNPEEFIGTTIECSCMSIDKVGHSLRHPRLMRFRPDKDPEQCLWNDVFN